MSLYTDEDRDVGFLTKHDREFLEDPDAYAADKDHQRQLQYQRKRSIKKRLAQTFVDLTLLTNIDDELRDDLLEGANEELEEFEESRRETADELSEKETDDLGDFDVIRELEKLDQDTQIAAVSLLYEFFEDYADVAFENILGEAVTKAVYRNTELETGFPLSSADVTVEEPEVIDTEYVREKVEKGQYYDLNRAQLLYAIYSTTVQHERISEGEGLIRLFTESGYTYGENGEEEMPPPREMLDDEIAEEAVNPLLNLDISPRPSTESPDDE